MSEAARIGLLGGTFDPIHQGHLWLAEYARETLGLAKVWFLPSACPPHKDCLTSAQQRARMVQLAIADHAAFRLCSVELQRPGPSYTVDTLRQLKQLQPATHFVLLLGTDQVASLPTWHCYESLPSLAELVEIDRPGVSSDSVPRIAGDMIRCYLQPEIGHWLSSSLLRQRMAAGKSIRYLVPDRVGQFIRKEGLYGYRATP